MELSNFPHSDGPMTDLSIQPKISRWRYRRVLEHPSAITLVDIRKALIAAALANGRGIA